MVGPMAEGAPAPTDIRTRIISYSSIFTTIRMMTWTSQVLSKLCLIKINGIRLHFVQIRTFSTLEIPRWVTPFTWPGGLCHMETRDSPSPKGLLISPDSPGLSDLCFYFPIQLTPPTSPLALFLSVIEEKHSHLGRNNHHPPSIKGMAQLFCNNNQQWFGCERRREDKRRKGENWGQNSPPIHGAPGRPYEAVHLTLEMKPACYAQQHKKTGTLKFVL